jgi:hypothetical protein
MTIPINAGGAETTDKMISGLIAWPVWTVLFFMIVGLISCIPATPSKGGEEYLVELALIVYVAGGFGSWTSLFWHLKKRRWQREHGANAAVPPNFFDEGP